jgi:K+-sensing histidine kinase KdpD
MSGDASGYILILLGIGISWLAITKKNILLGVLSSAIWLLLFIFLRTTPIAGFSTGGAGDTVTTVILFGLAAGVPITCITFWRQQKVYNERDEQEWHNKEDSIKAKKNPTISDISNASNTIDYMNMDDAAYANLLRGSKRNKR